MPVDILPILLRPGTINLVEASSVLQALERAQHTPQPSPLKKCLRKPGGAWPLPPEVSQAPGASANLGDLCPALRATMFVLAQQGGREGIVKKVFNEVSKCEVRSRTARGWELGQGCVPSWDAWLPGAPWLWLQLPMEEAAEPGGIKSQVLLHTQQPGAARRRPGRSARSSNPLSALPPLCPAT